MQAATQTAAVSKGSLWTGYVLSAIPTLLILMGAVMDLIGSQKTVEDAAKLGYPASSLPIIGVLSLIAVVLYVVPRTAVLGALFVTAFFGAAVATHIRAGQSLAWCLPAVIVCTIAWAGLILREPRLRDLLPVRK
jgi:sorbitol-specific phosphotransferase system component IIC